MKRCCTYVVRRYNNVGICPPILGTLFPEAPFILHVQIQRQRERERESNLHCVQNIRVKAIEIGTHHFSMCGKPSLPLISLGAQSCYPQARNERIDR